jgi:hypothetical protein
MKLLTFKSCFLLWFSALIVLAAFGQASQAVTQEWAAIYDCGASDYPQDIALDSSGNVYVTGHSYIDGWTVTTIKYDSAGNQLWVRNYDYRPGTGLLDLGNAIAVDSSGNVYVTGATAYGSDVDVLTIMYDTNGNFQWAATYGSATNSYDEGHDIAVNSTTGDVYITGRSDGNLIIIRYNSAGAEQFVNTYGGTLACGYGIAIDSSGNVYATGYNGTDYITIKRNSSLNTELWSVTYNGPGGGTDTAYGIALDSSGNAYVTGKSPGLGTGNDCATIKYSSAAGASLWVKRYDNAGVSDSGEAIVVDSSGNAYVTGTTDSGAGTTDYLTIMYDTAGVQQWVKLYDGGSGNDMAHGIAIDTNTPPNVYVTGESSSAFSSWDFATIMYDNAGNQQWVMRYNGISNLDDHAQAIAVYDKNNIYVIGEATGDYATVKYSQAGAVKIVKWEQLPNLTEQGIDVNDTKPSILADDFNCTTTGPITEITVWGSWKGDYIQMPGAVKFRLSIHSDIPDNPQDPNGYSRPGNTLWMKEFLPGQFTVGQEAINLEEGWMDPPLHYIPWADTICWKYTFTIDPNQAFTQSGKPNSPIVYWLDVQAEPEGTMSKFGWKTARTHWNDDAVWGMGMEPYPGPWNELIYPPQHPFHPESIDLAFRIVTEGQEEPEDPNLKYLQPPDLTETGVDVRFDRSDGITRILADDFPCTTMGRITGVKLWGSWLNDLKGTVQMIHLSIHTDIPASESPTGYSMPGTLLWQRDVTPSDINETLEYILPQGQYEWWWDPYMPVPIPFGDTQVWRYNIHIPWTFAFVQQGEPNNPKVYWLDAWAIVKDQSGGNTAQFGWKSSRIHWNDDAVYDYGSNNWLEMRYPPGHPYSPESMDLAFELRTEPECYAGMADYAQWVDAKKPECWCYPRQQRGDGDGLKAGGTKTGYYYVDAGDLTLLTGAWKVRNPPFGPGLSGTQGCADFDHKKAGSTKTGYYRVDAGDLTILTAYWKVREPPQGPGVPPDSLPGNRVPH